MSGYNNMQYYPQQQMYSGMHQGQPGNGQQQFHNGGGYNNYGHPQQQQAQQQQMMNHYAMMQQQQQNQHQQSLAQQQQANLYQQQQHALQQQQHQAALQQQLQQQQQMAAQQQQQLHHMGGNMSQQQAHAAQLAAAQQQHLAAQQQAQQQAQQAQHMMGGGGGAMMGGMGASNNGGLSNAMTQQMNQSLAFKHLTDMYSTETREQAMQEMAKIRDHEKDMGLYIWHATGIMAILVQELIAVYPLLNPLTLSMTASSRVSNALTLLQCVASHNDTRRRFLDSQMVNFLLPFLSSSSHSKALECARLTALGVIGGLVKNDDSSAIESLLQLEIVPVCLRIMESGSELCKTLATFVIQKILSADKGLEYMCNPKYPARFTAVATVLKTMVSKDNKDQLTTRLLRLILRCYSNFTHNRAAKDALKTCLPDELRNNTHLQLIESDQTVKKVWRDLLTQLDDSGINNNNNNNGGGGNNNGSQQQFSR